ncbi:hypothetical protein O7606_18825 [Micromonospora sp. WMMD882]|uniref:hypothetical protein n=1 Tax=Micromonospora sp. WMMD882 TaxID=3015151 RepID=UPI00248BDC58|nr:hypothetical protein [Micromonospora sp. WMMD882]WBB78276.1 hypothetical protein O7606_18825 [Micromonospora sp. WMMD882]
MDDHLIALVPVAAVWVAAGVVADGLPRLHRARALRRRAGWSITLCLAGLGLMASVTLAALGTVGTTSADRAAAGFALAALPALLVAVCTVRRLRRLRAGAAALAAAPRAPVPPGLRAHAAHPLVGLPLQLTGLALAVAAVVASDLGAGLAGGPALTLGLLAVASVGVRHALRHDRLASRAPAEGPVGQRA